MGTNWWCKWGIWKILQNNKEVMASARNTTPASLAFREIFGDYWNTEASERLLATGYISPQANISPNIRNILTCLQKPQHCNDKYIKCEVTQEEFILLFQKTRENTSSSPSGIHMGHYKVAAMIPTVSRCLEKMMSLPFMYCFSPARWEISTHMMLEKIQGVPRLDKLRII